MSSTRELASHIKRDAKVDELVSIIEEGQKLHRKVGNTPSGMETEDLHKMLAIDLAKYPLDFMQEFVDALNRDTHNEEEGYEELDLRVMEAVLLFIQKTGGSSVRQLLQFLEAVIEGDYAYLVVQACGRNREIRVRSHLSDEALKEFGFQ